MSTIEATEQKIKDHIEELTRERNILKDKCEKVKQNIKLNRTKYAKSIEEFGNDRELDDDVAVQADQPRISTVQPDAKTPRDSQVSHASDRSSQIMII